MVCYRAGHSSLASPTKPTDTGHKFVPAKGAHLSSFQKHGLQGFDGNLPTIHLGSTQPSGYIVQVTEEAVHIVQPASGPGKFELVASWRPPPALSAPPSSRFKMQHAGTAGNTIAVVCESTMILIQVQERTPTATGGTCGSPPNSKTCSAAELVAEVQRIELSVGPASALGMRLFGSEGDARNGEEVESISLLSFLLAILASYMVC